MGIPGLTKKLEGYAEHVTFSSAQEAQRKAVIDGPALAYHILNLCLEHSDRHSPFENLPEYRDIAVTTIHWLQALSSCGFTISAIYFDGFLPWSKKNERVSRLQESTNSLLTYRARYSDGTLGQLKPASAVQYEVTTIVPPQGGLAAPPCFISAVLETLHRSPFANRVLVAPGEADLFCARKAKEQASYVLTGDSDLLVHDIGPEGRVAFFKDIELFGYGDNRSVNMLVYHPKAIAELLEITDLVGMAYFAKGDRRRSIVEAAMLAKKESPNGPKYEDFKRLYTDLEVTEFERSLDAHNTTHKIAMVRKMEPRVLELVLQLQVSAVKSASSSSGRTLYWFLPFMLEDPSKSSAHQPSADLRRLMYSILQIIDPNVACVSEYSRRGTSISPTAIFIHKLDALQALLSEAAGWFSETLNMYQKLPVAARWRAIAITVVNNFKSQAGKPLLHRNILQLLVLNDRRPSLTWAFLHARSEMQSVLYVLAILEAILSLVIELQDILRSPQSVLPSVRALQEVIEPLPGIADLFDWHDYSSVLQEGDAKDILDMLDSLSVDDQHPSVDGDNNGYQEKSKKKRRRGSKTQAAATLPKKASIATANAYDTLMNMNDD